MPNIFACTVLLPPLLQKTILQNITYQEISAISAIFEGYLSLVLFSTEYVLFKKKKIQGLSIRRFSPEVKIFQSIITEFQSLIFYAFRLLSFS